MFRKSLYLVAAIWLCASVQAQNSDTDSLINLLSKTKEDTNKVNLYWNIGASIIFQNPSQAIPYFKQGIVLAKKLNYNVGIEKCYNGTSLCFSYNAKYD